jgi:peptidylprolyl isomerase
MAIKNGDKVSVQYEGKLDNGQVFDSTQAGEQSKPLEFEVGSGQVIKGFDEAVVGMEQGQEKEFTIPPEKAYGERREEFKKEIPRNALPQDKEPKVGMMLMARTPNGQQFPTKIVKVDDEKVVVDLNHPLAGQNLNFKVKVVGVNPGQQ